MVSETITYLSCMFFGSYLLIQQEYDARKHQYHTHTFDIELCDGIVIQVFQISHITL